VSASVRKSGQRMEGRKKKGAKRTKDVEGYDKKKKKKKVEEGVDLTTTQQMTKDCGTQTNPSPNNILRLLRSMRSIVEDVSYQSARSAPNFEEMKRVMDRADCWKRIMSEHDRLQKLILVGKGVGEEWCKYKARRSSVGGISP